MRGYDKWEAYLPLYKKVMEQIRPGSAYLEIGVQNMGWPAVLDSESRFTRCVACDINPAIAEHVEGSLFTDIVVGDSATEETFHRINDLNLSFDLIVDDASHTQQNILANFMIYWPLLRDGGRFMIEDCHTDFSPPFSEKNYFGISIYDFFSALAALPTLCAINPVLRQKNAAYRTMRRFYPTEYCDAIADSIQCLTFANSCILIEKGDPSLGKRILDGDEWPIASPVDNSAFTLAALDNTIRKQFPDLAVVYLNRAATETETTARERFIRAYRRFLPEVPHELYVVNKGFSAEQLREQYMFFKDLTPRFINIDDQGFDLEAYRKAAIQIEEPIIFFMNTHSEPLQHGWLDKVYAAFTSSSQIGLVGCSGSMETHHPFAPGFPGYPNYHVRTNGFMIARQDYLDITEGRPLENKLQAYQFEAGRLSMTWMIQSSGRRALVVGKQGTVQPQILWYANIFRSWNQRNLLLADNQTRAYQKASFLGKLKIWALSHSCLSQLHPQRLRWQMSNRSLTSLTRKLSEMLRRDTDRPSQQDVIVRQKPLAVSSQHRQAGNHLAVLVPTHLEQLDEKLAATLLHNAIQLKGYKLEVILPGTCSPSWYEAFFAEHGIDGTVRLVRAEYFGSPAAVNKMGTDPAFYRMYREFDYILVCHLDAWVFRDQLAHWMDKGYDFIGAPLFLPENDKVHFLQRMAPFGGNGGLSLRRVASCIRVLETFKPGRSPWRIAQAVWFLARNRQWGFIAFLFRLLRELSRDWRGTCEKYNIYEDVFFTIIAPLCGNHISIPSSRAAMKFACEVNYPLFQKELFSLEPPFGIHGYDKYVDPEYLDYVRGFFARKKQHYDRQMHTAPPLVSVIMVVKNLISSGRMATFDQALMSVVNQTYSRLEVVVLDGASTDGTFEALQERYGYMTRIAFHCKADQNVWEGMSNGVDLAKGDLIAFMNSDDYFCTPEALELMVHRMVEIDADMAYGQSLLLTDQGPMPFPTHLPSVLNCYGVVHQATLVKKSVIMTIQPFTAGHVTAENYLFVAILMAGFKVAEVPETLVHYRVGGLSTDLYGGSNYEGTKADYLRYMKKLTTIGRYLSDDEIKLLYGFTGLYEIGPIRFTRMILRIRDQRLQRLLLSGTWKKVREYGIRKLIKGKLLYLMTRKYVAKEGKQRSRRGRFAGSRTADEQHGDKPRGV